MASPFPFGTFTGGRKEYNKKQFKKLRDQKIEYKDYLSSFYNPVEGFTDDKIEKAFRKRYKAKDYDKMIKFFDSLWEMKGETTAEDLLSGWISKEAEKPWPKDIYKTQPGYEPTP